MRVLCYTRQPKEDILYANRLAYSMHLAWESETGAYIPFHHNEGILYAKATQDMQTGVLCAKSLKNPWIFHTEGGSYGIAAVRTGADGEPDTESEGCILVFRSDDLVHYEEVGLWRVQQTGYVGEIRCAYDAATGTYLICWSGEDGSWQEGRGRLFDADEIALETVKTTEKPAISKHEFCETASTKMEQWLAIEGICPGNAIELPDEQGAYLIRKLMTPVCGKVTLSSQGALSNEVFSDGAFCSGRSFDGVLSDIVFSSKEDLLQAEAVAVYSDGTVVSRRIDWNLDTSEESEDGKYMLFHGRVHQEHFDSPFAVNRADPCCMYWHGKYYYIATNDADGNKTLYIRCADTLEGIMEAEEVLILDAETHPGIGGLLWAPEFHEIDGTLYLFHAATSGEFFCEESRVMKLKDGGDPMCREDWSAPQLVVRKDGTPLCEEGKVISLDMTTFTYQGETYAMWSQRQFLPVDQGAWLYLAQIDAREPWKLVSDPVCIAKPEYGWENNHTFVVEGPYALERGGQLMVTYSGAAVDATYAVGMLKPRMGSDILKPENWEKCNYPLLTSRSAEGEYGTGHNAYLTDERGMVWNFYHARPGVDAPRSSFARRVHFDIDNEPVLDVLEALDLPEQLRHVVGRVRQNG